MASAIGGHRDRLRRRPGDQLRTRTRHRRPTPAYGVRIETNTPQGVRAKQVMDMLNSDWPIGPVSVKTLAAPDMVDEVAATMDSTVVGPALHR